jgi:hypothetical protein
MSESESESNVVAKLKTEGGQVINVEDNPNDPTGTLTYRSPTTGQARSPSQVGKIVQSGNVEILESPSGSNQKQLYNEVYDSGEGLNPNRFSPSDTGAERKVKTFMRKREVRNAVKSNPLIPSSKEDEAREMLAKEILEAFDQAGNSDRARQKVIDRYDLQS